MEKLKRQLAWFGEQTRLTVLFYAGLLALCFPLVHRYAYANDLWKALYSGRFLALNLNFPDHSEFTFSPVVDFVVRDSYNWLGNLTFYGLHQLGGISLLLILKFCLVIFAVVMIHSLIDYKINPLILLLFFFFIVGIYQKLLLRTAMFIIPFATLFWWVYFQAREKKRHYWIWGIPLVFLFWGNMHGSYLIGFSFLLIVAAGDFLDFIFETGHPGYGWLLKLGVVVLIVFLIITFVKPFPDYMAASLISGPVKGLGGMITLQGGSGGPETGEAVEAGGGDTTAAVEVDKGSGEAPEQVGLRIYEQLKRFHQNLFIAGAYDEDRSSEFSYPGDHLTYISVIPSYLIILITLGAFWTNPHRITFRHLGIWLAAATLGTAFIRTLPLIALTMVPLLFIKYDRGDFEGVELGESIHLVAMAAALIIALNLGYLFWTGSVHKAVGSSMHRLGFGLHPRFSNAVVDYARENFAHEPGFNNYNTGGYLIWNWWPEKRVFIDSKSSAYAPDFMDEYRNTTPPTLVERYDLEHAVLTYDSNSVFYYFIPSPEWAIEVMDQWYILFVKTDEPRSRSVGDYLDISTDEVEGLDVEEATVLKNVMAFIEQNQNDKNKIGKFKSLSSWKQRQLMEVNNEADQ